MRIIFFALFSVVLLFGCAGLEKPLSKKTIADQSVSEVSQEDSIPEAGSQSLDVSVPPLKSLDWCNSGDSITIEGSELSILGLEGYESDTVQGKLCHLSKLNSKFLNVDYFIDKTAFSRFSDKGVDEGKGCVVFAPKSDPNQKFEACFGVDEENNA